LDEHGEAGIFGGGGKNKMVTYNGAQLKVAVKATTPAYTDATATIDISFDFERDLEEVYKHGDPAPQELKPGHWRVSGSMTRNFETGNFSAAGVTFQAMAIGTTAMHIAIFPEGDALPKIDLEDCLFSGYSIKGPLKGIVQESCKFSGLLITLT
jgi:hypothetical protein